LRRGPLNGAKAGIAMSNTVLVVDDTPSKRYVLASWLRRGGYTVVEAATGIEALQRVRAGGIDLVVLDVRLPDISGFEVCEQIKADPVFGTTPVIHVSAAAIHAVDRTRGLERGADGYLVEPIDPDELLATVASVLHYYQARIKAELLAGRMTNLARVGLEMGATTDHGTLLHIAAAGATRIFDSAVVLLAVAPDGTRLVASCAGPDQPVRVRPSAVQTGDVPVGITFGDYPASQWPQTEWPGGDTVRVLAVRPRADRSAVFVVVPSRSIADGTPELTLFGQSLMAALDSIRLYEEEHDLALTLQRSLLPRVTQQLDGLEIAVRYVPASDRAEIGGDFYEVATVNGRVFIAVGDVGGHSLHAATVMAELRHATRAYLADGHGPAAVLDRLNRLMTTFMIGEIATICMVAIDPETGEVRLANAGHPPPVLWTPVGPQLISAHSPLLGIEVRPATEISFCLEPQDTLALYTDGLIEKRGEKLDDSLVRLTQSVGTPDSDLETFASRLLADVGPGKPADDIAMVVVRRATNPVRSGMDRAESGQETSIAGSADREGDDR
jgi:CheY-like chemotaxis protein